MRDSCVCKHQFLKSFDGIMKKKKTVSRLEHHRAKSFFARTISMSGPDETTSREGKSRQRTDAPPRWRSCPRSTSSPRPPAASAGFGSPGDAPRASCCRRSSDWGQREHYLVLQTFTCEQFLFFGDATVRTQGRHMLAYIQRQTDEQAKMTCRHAGLLTNKPTGRNTSR